MSWLNRQLMINQDAEVPVNKVKYLLLDWQQMRPCGWGWSFSSSPQRESRALGCSPHLLIPGFPVWFLIGRAPLIGEHRALKKCKGTQIYSSPSFFKHLRIHFILCLWQEKMYYYCYYLQWVFKWNWCIQRKISLVATQPLLQSPLFLVVMRPFDTMR